MKDANPVVLADRPDEAGTPSVSPEPLSFVVHCHLRWDFVWQRPQQIFSRLAARHPVLFIEDPIHEDGAAQLRISEPYPNLVRVIPVLPREPAAGVDVECETILPLIEQARWKHPLLAGRFESPVQWFYSPMTAPVFLGQLGARTVVYDCMDELANFRFAPPDIGRREQLLLSRAAVVFTGGYRLFESKSRHHSNVSFFGCGVDFEHYSKARLPDTDVPAEIADLRSPVLGYFGVVDERLDYELIARLADDVPGCTVVMAGPFAKVDPAELPQRPNIRWLGQRAYSELPALVKGFDVCLMPFAMNEATQFINPTKTLEYMAAGKPVVSTPVPDVVRNFTPIVDIANDADGFVAAVRRAYETPRVDLISRGIEKARESSWDSIVASMQGRVLAALVDSEEP